MCADYWLEKEKRVLSNIVFSVVTRSSENKKITSFFLLVYYPMYAFQPSKMPVVFFCLQTIQSFNTQNRHSKKCASSHKTPHSALQQLGLCPPEGVIITAHDFNRDCDTNSDCYAIEAFGWSLFLNMLWPTCGCVDSLIADIIPFMWNVTENLPVPTSGAQWISLLSVEQNSTNNVRKCLVPITGAVCPICPYLNSVES